VEPKSQTGPDWMKVEAPAAQRSGTTFAVTGGVAGSINSQPQVSGVESPAPAATGPGEAGCVGVRGRRGTAVRKMSGEGAAPVAGAAVWFILARGGAGGGSRCRAG